MIKTILLFLSSLIITSGVVWAQESASQPPQEFQGFNLQGYKESGEKAWDVLGDQANVNGAEVELKNVNANSYGDQKVNVTAENGKINQVSGEMELKKDVVVTSEDGTQLYTDTLKWNRNQDLVTTDDDVTIADEQFTATGTGMTAKPGLKTAQIRKDVTVLVDTEPEQPAGDPVTITSDGPMTIDQGKSMAMFEDNVVAVQLDRTLKADKMEIYFNEAMNDIREMVCIGNVQIIQGENKSFAEKAVYNAVEKKVVLSGRPKLIMQTQGEMFEASGN